MRVNRVEEAPFENVEHFQSGVVRRGEEEVAVRVKRDLVYWA